ncbi:hypothetical protein BpHYR1_037755 [Brachionus plicatilis]|uniref:Uncharacterized protein n=1 Tax=Brachionus plicatilis TaxID=10195 RepID=A0A3M7R9X7_BRAPC|nr:hypothetical protein BpHYR1_037755 [Brachionus plicatilis]
MNNNLNLNVSPSNLAASVTQPCTSSSLQAHQMPRKAYFLNKYEQNNPQTKASIGEIAAAKPKDQMTSQQGSKRHFSGSNSSLQNSDDDDDEFADMDTSQGGTLSKSKEEKRRLSHTAAEQKRRNAIKVRANFTMYPLFGQKFGPHLEIQVLNA